MLIRPIDYFPLINQPKFLSNTILEANDIKVDNHFDMDILDVNEFIKVNDVKEISDPIFFVRDNIPSPNGLLSNDIFGITKDERANIYGYIDLSEYFIHPLIYKLWSRLDSNFKNCVHGTKNFIINSSGHLVESEDGETGLTFIKKNIDKIKIKRSESSKRDDKIKFIYTNKKNMFINKYLVIPPFYRDVNTSKKNVSVGEINKLYQSLILGVRSIKEANEYGFDMSNANKARVQETLVSIYDWFSGNSNNSIEGGTGMSQKKGILQNAVLSKTTDYSSRLVLTAPNLAVEYTDDLICDLDHCMLPLASALTNFKPFILFHVKRFFENEFNEASLYPYRDRKTGEVKYGELENPFIEFSDERIEEEMKRYIYGYSNRLIPIRIPFKDKSLNYYMGFKGTNTNANLKQATKVNTNIDDQIQNSEDTIVIGRKMTWMDVFYIAAVEACKDKHVLVTRYPIDSCYNQVPLKPIISTTYTNVPLWYNGQYYKYYPNIKEEDIGTDTSDKFIDTMIMSNLIIKIMNGDYDGDTVSVRGVWSIEANEELDRYLNSKANFIDIGAKNIRFSSAEAVQSIFDLTKILSTDNVKLKDPVF